MPTAETKLEIFCRNAERWRNGEKGNNSPLDFEKWEREYIRRKALRQRQASVAFRTLADNASCAPTKWIAAEEVSRRIEAQDKPTLSAMQNAGYTDDK